MLTNKSKILIAASVAAAALLIVTQGAWSNRHYQLGGAFIGGSGDTWNSLAIPLDPEGRTAAVRVGGLSYAGWGGLVAQLGANAASELVGEMAMISNDTAKSTMVSYFQMLNPDNTLEIKAILVWTGTVKFTGPDTEEINYTVKIYDAATADVSPKDGLPDAGAVPILTIPGITGTGKRVRVQ